MNTCFPDFSDKIKFLNSQQNFSTFFLKLKFDDPSEDFYDFFRIGLTICPRPSLIRGLIFGFFQVQFKFFDKKGKLLYRKR